MLIYGKTAFLKQTIDSLRLFTRLYILSDQFSQEGVMMFEPSRKSSLTGQSMNIGPDVAQICGLGHIS